MKKSIILLAISLLLLPSYLFGGWDEGVAAFKNKNYKQAITEFSEVIQQNPNSHSGHYMLGLSYELYGNHDKEALTHLRKAYDLNPNDLAIKLSLGRLYHTNKQSNNALLVLRSIDRTQLPDKQKMELDKLLAIGCNCSPKVFRNASEHSWVEFRLPEGRKNQTISINGGAFNNYVFPKCNRVFWSSLTFQCNPKSCSWEKVSGRWGKDAMCHGAKGNSPYVFVGKR